MRTVTLGTMRIVLMLGGILFSAGVVAQPSATSAPSAADRGECLVAPSIPYGSRISRAMRLLATSTPEHKHRVRILFYGQSITGGWTDIVLKDLRARFPNADMIAENHALGGFSAPWLSQTAEADLYPWYPDLLFLQDYGASDPAMERMCAAVRSRTTAEVLIFTHHLDLCADKSSEKPLDAESAKIRELAEKYRFEVVDVRPSWRKYLELNHLDRVKLLCDGIIHLNSQGNELMARIAIPHLRYDPQQAPAGPDRVRYYDAAGKLLQGSFDDAAITALKGPLRFEFEGNRVDVAAAADGRFGTAAAEILIDGKKPSTFHEMYAATRTNPAPGSWFPAIRCLELGAGVVPENWELTITRINDKCSEFEYEVKGSKTGPDGKGNSKEKFTSNSGRLIIEPQTFCFESAHQIFKKPVPVGFKVVWSVYGTFLDEWKPRKIADPAKENLYTLAQGLPNGKHVLEIIPYGDGELPLRYLAVYQPMPPAGPVASRDKRLGPLLNLNGYFPFSPPPSREAWQRRAAQLRRQVLVAAGLWPMPEKSPLRAVIHGKVDRQEYTVEKVFFESWPGHYVAGNLYRPKGRSGKLPAVLSPYGHWPEGRFIDAGRKEARQQIVAGAERFESGGRSPLQARCVQLARMGCVVFHYDMVGYADSRQLAHRAGRRPEMSGPQAWGFFSPQAEARLQTIFGLQTYNSIRALDFLCGLPDVDPARIGVTGASGGGTQTFILCAIDPRPAVAVPAVMVSTAMQGGCPCENASYLRIGTGNVELAALLAPKPLGLIAADDWTKEIAAKGLPELKRLYRLFAAEDRVMAKPLLQFPHNYNFVSRAVMYSWFNKHLKLGQEEPIVEEDFRPLSRAEMSVWDARHPAPPGGPAYERALLRRMTDDARRQMDRLLPKDAASLREYRRIVGGAVEAMVGRGLPAQGELEAAKPQSQDFGGRRITRFLLRYPAKGEELPAVRLDPQTWNHRTVIWIDRGGKQALFTASGAPRPGVRRLLDKGFAVLAADLFGQGEFTADGKPLAKARMNRSDEAAHDEGWGRYAGYTFAYNPPLFVQRVHDVLSLAAFARNEPAAEHVDMVATGGAGHWAAAARAIAGGAIERAAIDTDGFRFAALTAVDDPDFLPGGAKYGDLPGMIALSAPHPLWLAGEGASPPSEVSAAYRAAGRPENAILWQGEGKNLESAAVEWLLMEPPN